MAWLPISGIVPQATESGNQADGMVLKFYENGTLTPLTVATDSTGATTTTEFVLDAQGYTTLSTVKVIPHVDQVYKVALYLDQTDADADDTGSAVFVINGVNVGNFASVSFANYSNLNDAIIATFGNVGDFITTGEYNAGTGVGGGKYEIVAADPGYNLINPAKTDGSGYFLQLIGLPSLEQAGADPLGINDSTLSMHDIINAGFMVTSESNGEFLLSSASQDSFSKIDMEGPFTIKGDGYNTTTIFDTCLDFRFVNISCKEMKSLMENDGSSAALTQHITKLHILDNDFSDMNYITSVSTFAATSANVTAKNMKINNNTVTDCGGGFYVRTNIFGYEANFNTFRDIGVPRNVGIPNESVIGLSLGRGTLTAEATSTAQGQGDISGNKFYDFTNNSTSGAGGATNFIQMHGNGVHITGNTGNRLSSSEEPSGAIDQEGIYWKGLNCTISNNTLVDAGDNEGAIKGKGVAVGVAGIEGLDNIITDNVIEWTSSYAQRQIGISVISGSATITDNRIKGAVNKAISSTFGDKVIISRNVIESVSGGSIGAIEAFVVFDCDDVAIEDNFIEINGDVDGNLYGISCTPYTKEIKSLSINRNKITLINEKAAATGSIRDIRVADGSNGVGYLDICNNVLGTRDGTRTMIGISTSISGTTRSVSIQDNINDMSTTGSLTDIVFAPIPSDVFKYENNAGFTTNFTGRASTTDLNDIADLINVVDKYEGKLVFDSTLNRPVYAAGSTAADTWVFSDGTLANTPV
jgi:hypothetical protein